MCAKLGSNRLNIQLFLELPTFCVYGRNILRKNLVKPGDWVVTYLPPERFKAKTNYSIKFSGGPFILAKFH